MYFVRGATLALAAFFLLNACFSCGIHLLVRLAGKTSARLNAKATWLFLLKVFPACAAVFCTFLLVIPSYLSLEPKATAERMGWFLPLVAALSAWLLASAWLAAIALWRKSRMILRDWLRRSQPLSLPGVEIPAYRLQEDFPVVAVIGALRPRLFVSEQVLAALEPEEFSAAIQHEMGHLIARDNLKRWLAEICPPALPFVTRRGNLGLWHAAAEQCADRYAVQEGKAAPLHLASALIKVSRMVPLRHQPAIPAGAYLVERQDVPEIARRVHALLDAAADRGTRAPGTAWQRAVLLYGFLASAILLLAISYSSVLVGVHEVLEKFLHLIS